MKLLERYPLATAHPFALGCMSDACSRIFGGGASYECPQPATKVLVFAITLRYHQVFRIAVARTRSQLCQPAHFPFSITTGWRNALPSIASSAARLNTDNSIELAKVGLGTEGTVCVSLSTHRQLCNLGHVYSKCNVSESLSF